MLSRFFNAMSLTTQERYMIELLELNEKTKSFGLVLAPEEIKQLMIARNQVLQSYGRLELGIEVTKAFIEVFSESPYIHPQNYVSMLSDLHEIFYYIKNETEDRIGDFKLIALLKQYFDNECGGSIELLRSRIEQFAVNFRTDTMRKEILLEGDDV